MLVPCSFQLPMCFVIKMNHIFFSNNIFAIKVILQISPGSPKEVVYFYHHYFCLEEIDVRKMYRGGKFLNTNCICR